MIMQLDTVRMSIFFDYPEALAHEGFFTSDMIGLVMDFERFADWVQLGLSGACWLDVNSRPSHIVVMDVCLPLF